MKRKIAWLLVSCIMVLSLVLASCAPAAQPEEKPTQPAEKPAPPEEKPAPPEEKPVQPEAKMVKVKLTQNLTVIRWLILNSMAINWLKEKVKLKLNKIL